MGVIEVPLVSLTNTRCSGTRQGPNSNSVLVTMQGTITALKTVISGTITGYANEQLVGAYNLSAMSPGQSADFTMYQHHYHERIYTQMQNFLAGQGPQYWTPKWFH